MELALRHIRNGVELEPIDVNRNYDFDFQQTNFIPSVQILPVSNLHMQMYVDIEQNNIIYIIAANPI